MARGNSFAIPWPPIIVLMSWDRECSLPFSSFFFVQVTNISLLDMVGALTKGDIYIPSVDFKAETSI